VRSDRSIPMPEISKLFLSRKEALIQMGVSLPTLERRIKDGTIPHIKLGSRVLIPAAALDRMVESAMSERDV